MKPDLVAEADRLLAKIDRVASEADLARRVDRLMASACGMFEHDDYADTLECGCRECYETVQLFRPLFSDLSPANVDALAYLVEQGIDTVVHTHFADSAEQTAMEFADELASMQQVAELFRSTVSGL